MSLQIMAGVVADCGVIADYGVVAVCNAIADSGVVANCRVVVDCCSIADCLGVEIIILLWLSYCCGCHIVVMVVILLS